RSHAPMPERQAEIRTDLARAMQQLEPVQREMLWLAYAQGASHEEIAGILGLRAVSIRTLLLRARRKLAGILTGNAPQESGR
ncbi:MAG TPA: sigma-70 family RNA polymerase sigma factor, partial [Thermoanaerobaculia bacterium]|nr:sigma-70 family RNA polymerase sigma factor [Thermoanaerobaculia bacterium]